MSHKKHHMHPALVVAIVLPLGLVYAATQGISGAIDAAKGFVPGVGHVSAWPGRLVQQAPSASRTELPPWLKHRKGFEI